MPFVCSSSHHAEGVPAHTGTHPICHFEEPIATRQSGSRAASEIATSLFVPRNDSNGGNVSVVTMRIAVCLIPRAGPGKRDRACKPNTAPRPRERYNSGLKRCCDRKPNGRNGLAATELEGAVEGRWHRRRRLFRTCCKSRVVLCNWACRSLRRYGFLLDFHDDGRSAD
jgi:hypothetical protein